MEIVGRRMPSVETVSRVLSNLVRPEKEKLPLVVAFYLSFGCNARCDFCSQGEYVFGGEKGRYNGDVQVGQQVEVLRAIRRDVPSVYFVGGEPTVYPGFEKILQASADLDFDTIGVNTNGLLFRPEILEHANLLVVSLHSMDPAKIASVYNVVPRWGEQALKNIRRYAEEKGEGMEMTVNCVVTSDNFRDVYEVAEFCDELGIKLNVSPAVFEGGAPDLKLIGNPEYRRLIDWLMGQNGLMASSKAYLKIIRDFEPFVCTPHVVPGIHPNGDMVVPCPNLPEGKEMVNVLEAGGVKEALEIGRARFEERHGVLDTQRECAKMCHKTCYVEAACVSSVAGLVKLVRGRFGV